MKRTISLVVWASICAAVGLWWLGCLRVENLRERPSQLRIAAASNLQTVMDELARTFRLQSPHVELICSYGASGLLCAQIVHGAPYDFFCSADQKYTTELVNRGIVSREDQFVFAQGRLVLWVPHDLELGTDELGLELVLDDRIQRVALANPQHAPYGRAAQQALEKAGIWLRVQRKLVFGDNVTHAAQFAQSGTAQVAFLALAQVVQGPLQAQGQFWLVPADMHEPLLHTAAVLRKSLNQQAAEQFALFLRTSNAQEILRRYGFELPDDPLEP